jgi:predicted amidohydrolase
VAGATDPERWEFNVSSAERLLAEAAARGSDIACLPETFQVTGIEAEVAQRDFAESVPGGPAFQRMAAIARKHSLYVIAPLLCRVEGILRNAAVFIDRNGEYLGCYHKVHLTTPEREAGIVAGDDYPVFELDFGHVGAAICYDVNFPEIFRLLALDGAEIIFHPTVYSMYGEVGWEAVIRARAIDNCVYVCPVNHGNTDLEPWMPGMGLGRSSVIGPDGLTLADTGRYAGVAVATVDLDRPRMVRSMGVAGEANFREQMWKHRRPETYGKITDGGYWLRQWSSD